MSVQRVLDAAQAQLEAVQRHGHVSANGGGVCLSSDARNGRLADELRR